MPFIGTSENTGMIKEWTSATLPAGYLFCDGTLYPTATYPSLFSIIGTNYNIVGDAAGYFRVPDLRGKTPLGTGQDVYQGLTNRSLAEYVGEELHVLGTSELGLHTHSQGTMQTETQAHGHTATTNQYDLNHTHSYTEYPNSGSDNGPSGGGTSAGQNNAGTGAAQESLYHNHNSTMGDNIGDHTHTLTTGTGDGVTDTGHNNMQPFLVLNFIIKY
jgi:microcystin-dependent protein